MADENQQPNNEPESTDPSFRDYLTQKGIIPGEQPVTPAETVLPTTDPVAPVTEPVATTPVTEPATTTAVPPTEPAPEIDALNQINNTLTEPSE